MNTTIFEKIDANVYGPKSLPLTPSPPDGVRMYADMSLEEFATAKRVIADHNDKYAAEMAAYRAAVTAHQNEEQRLLANFQRDLEKEAMVIGLPKAPLLFQLAWESHPLGLDEVAHQYLRMANLIR